MFDASCFEWVDRARRGDHEAFRSLIRAVEPELRKKLRHLDRQDAEDVLVDTLAICWERLGTLRHAERFVGFCRVIQSRVAGRALVQKRKQRALGGAFSNAAAPEDSPELAVAMSNYDGVADLLAMLRPDQSELVSQRFIEGRTLREIANQVGVAVSVIHERVEAARLALVRALSRSRPQNSV